jgi:mannonate dehydratase
MLAAAGLRWTCVESVPVPEDIKTGRGDLKRLSKNYADTLQNLAAEGLSLVIYNFMPVLDWIRTDLRHVLPDGSECMHFDPVRFAAFEIHALKRAGALADYSAEQVECATAWWQSLEMVSQENFIQTIIDVFPGCRLGLTLDDIRALLARYQNVREDDLRANLSRFLEAVIPVAEAAGMRMAIHPDDPPFPMLGLPRIVSTADQMEAIFKLADSPANGLCFCTGSLSARPDNDLPAMVKHLPQGSMRFICAARNGCRMVHFTRRIIWPDRWTCRPWCERCRMNRAVGGLPAGPTGSFPFARTMGTR